MARQLRIFYKIKTNSHPIYFAKISDLSNSSNISSNSKTIMLSRNIHVGKSSYILELVVSCSWLSSFSSSSIESTSQANQNMIGVYIGIDSVYYALCSVAAILVLIVFSPAAGFYINATLLAIQFWNSDKYIFGNFGKCSFISWYIGADSVWHGFGGKQQKIGRTTF